MLESEFASKILSHGSTIVCCAALLLWLGSSRSAAQAQLPIVTCRVTPVSIAVGNQAELSLDVENVQGLNGYELKLTYDPGVVEFKDADPDRELVNVRLGDFVSPDFLVLNDIEQPGELLLSLTQLGHSPARSGKGTLADAALIGRRIGRADFKVADVILYDINGSEIEHQVQNCSVEITQGPPPSAAETQPAATPPLTPPSEASISPVPAATSTATTPPSPANQPQPAATAAPAGTPTLVLTATIAPASVVVAPSTTALTLSLPYISNAIDESAGQAPVPPTEHQKTATAEPAATIVAGEQVMLPLVAPGTTQQTATATPTPQPTAQLDTPAPITHQQLQLSGLTGPTISLAWLFPLGFTLAGLGFLGLIIATMVFVSSCSASSR